MNKSKNHIKCIVRIKPYNLAGINKMMLLLVFSISLIGNIIITLELIYIILKSKRKIRVFPPQNKHSLQFWIYWILVTISYGNIFLLCILDWDSFIFQLWLRLPFGVFLIIIGLIIMLWGAWSLNISSSMGLQKTLIVRGLYKYSRNPQYIGNILLLIGIIIVSNSALTLVVGILGIFWTILLPFAEEPWLREQFGEKYKEYCKKVRRFL
ncbi:MAG: methyltransferase family protein [Candidatus Thorarchaeota archaeon]